jgi:hypothetical protein
VPQLTLRAPRLPAGRHPLQREPLLAAPVILPSWRLRCLQLALRHPPAGPQLDLELQRCEC